ncbi:hypothetical protein F5X96DRAFT_414350 [Biscogniauxia mediterranea]|nr:hypothetical protein F5X96DRAFT_414350 [Biscogniauxia mediterranea]
MIYSCSIHHKSEGTSLSVFVHLLAGWLCVVIFFGCAWFSSCLINHFLLIIFLLPSHLTDIHHRQYHQYHLPPPPPLPHIHTSTYIHTLHTAQLWLFDKTSPLFFYYKPSHIDFLSLFFFFTSKEKKSKEKEPLRRVIPSKPFVCSRQPRRNNIIQNNPRQRLPGRVNTSKDPQLLRQRKEAALRRHFRLA